MNRDDIIRMAREAGMIGTGEAGNELERLYREAILDALPRFAALVAAAEREKVAQWMIQRSYATGHGDTTEDLLAELEWQIAENWNRAMINGVETEREACAKLCEDSRDAYDGNGEIASWCAYYIRARGEQ